MPKPKWNLNTIYISERLQESLRPISRCAMTTVVAPMGYGKTTAVNWYLEERAKAEALQMIRISVYSDNLAIFWKSVQEAFARAGFDILRDYPCPTDAAGGGLLVDDLCHALADETPCYHLHRRFSPADRQARLAVPLYAGKPPARKCASDRCQPGPFSARCGGGAAGGQGVSDRHGAAAPEPHGAGRLCPPLRHGAFRRAGGDACSIPARGGSPPFI